MKIILFIIIFAFQSAIGHAEEKLVNENRLDLKWVDKNTNEIYFTIDDIVRFDWEKQIFELTRDKAIDLMAKPHRLYTAFLVKNNDTILYEGGFMSLLSCSGSNKPVISDGLIEKIFPPIYKISAAYPTDKYAENEKERFNPTMYKILKEKNKLETIDKNSFSPKIDYQFLGWYGEQFKFKILLMVFNETFRIKKKAVIHLRCAPAIKDEGLPDKLELSISIVANNGKFSLIKNYIVSRDYLDFAKTYIIKDDFWGSNENSQDKYAKPGKAYIKAHAKTYKLLNSKEFQLIKTYEIPKIDIKILNELK